MTETSHRAFIGGFAVAAGGLAIPRTHAADGDGRAAGYDVAPSSEHVASIPRRGGNPVTFTASPETAI